MQYYKKYYFLNFRGNVQICSKTLQQNNFLEVGAMILMV